MEMALITELVSNTGVHIHKHFKKSYRLKYVHKVNGKNYASYRLHFEDRTVEDTVLELRILISRKRIITCGASIYKYSKVDDTMVTVFLLNAQLSEFLDKAIEFWDYYLLKQGMKNGSS